MVPYQIYEYGSYSVSFFTACLKVKKSGRSSELLEQHLRQRRLIMIMIQPLRAIHQRRHNCITET